MCPTAPGRGSGAHFLLLQGMLRDQQHEFSKHDAQILRTARFSIPWIENPRSGPLAGLGNPPGFQPSAQDDNELKSCHPERSEGSVRNVNGRRYTNPSIFREESFFFYARMGLPGSRSGMQN